MEGQLKIRFCLSAFFEKSLSIFLNLKYKYVFQFRVIFVLKLDLHMF